MNMCDPIFRSTFVFMLANFGPGIWSQIPGGDQIPGVGPGFYSFPYMFMHMNQSDVALHIQQSIKTWNMAEMNTVVEGKVKYREGKKV